MKQLPRPALRGLGTSVAVVELGTTHSGHHHGEDTS
jgi:hypothetical protein